MKNVILNKKLPNKLMFTKYSIFQSTLVPSYLQMRVIFQLFITGYDIFQNEIIETSIFCSCDYC